MQGESDDTTAFEQAKREWTRLKPNDLDANGDLIVESGCEDCGVTDGLSEIYSSGDVDYFDPNKRQCTARLMLESCYNDCPVRTTNQETGWRVVVRRMVGRQTRINSIAERAQRVDLATEFPCGAERPTAEV